MLEQSFSHIKGIGSKTETQLWSSNIHDWSSLRNAKNVPLSHKKHDYLKKEISKSEKHLKSNNPNYFSTGLTSGQHWRLFKNFKSTTAYLDIETTGLYESSAIITTIALYDGLKIKYYVNGNNMDDFVCDILQYNLLVTYNGKCFDIPFIEKFFNISINHSHIDLRYVLHSLGYSGGLKNCEKQFSISRNDLEGVDGFFAIYLWEEYVQNKNQKALDTLLAYNIEDVVNLEYLMHRAYNLKISETPFEKQLKMDIPERPTIPFTPDLNTINKIKDRFYNPLKFYQHMERKSTSWKSFQERYNY